MRQKGNETNYMQCFPFQNKAFLKNHSCLTADAASKLVFHLIFLLSCCISLAYVWQLHFRNIGHLYNTTQELQERWASQVNAGKIRIWHSSHHCHLNYLIMRHSNTIVFLSFMHTVWKLFKMSHFQDWNLSTDFLTLIKHCVLSIPKYSDIGNLPL